MMLKIQRFAWSAVFVALTVTALAADTTGSSDEKARKAIAVLQSDAAPSEKAIACKRLAVYGKPDAVPALAPLLSDPELASWSRIALEVIPGPAADEALRGALNKVQGKLRVGVINSIGVRRDANAVDALVAQLKDTDADVTSAAAVALGRIGGSQAAQALEGALSTARAEVRSAVAEGCILCAERFVAGSKSAEAVKLFEAVRKSGAPQQRILEATRGVILARQSDGLPLLLETLRSTDKAVFGMGLRTARELQGGAVTKALAAELDRTDADRQGKLLLALTDRGDEAVWPAVFAAVKNGSKSLRMVAIGVLERQGNVSSLPVLLDAASARDPEVAKAAKAAVGRLPGREVDAELAARLPQAAGQNRLVLVELAGQRKVVAAVPELIKTSSDADPTIRAAAIKALGETVSATELGALTDLLAKAKSAEEASDVEAALESACTRIPDKTACADKLLACLSSGTTSAQCSALRLLTTTSTPKALDAVKSSLTHNEAEVRNAAFRALADWPEAAALPALLDVFRTTQADVQRTLALRGAVRLLGLGSQPLAQTVQTYGELLTNARRVDDRKMVLSGLANVTDPAAIKLVEPLLAEAQIENEAELALLSIASGITGSASANAKAIATKLQASSKNPATRERAAQILRQIEKAEDYVTAWQFAGSYTLGSGDGGSLFAKAFPPETSDSKVIWRPLAAGTQSARPWMLDLLATRRGEARCVGYARTWIYSDKAQPARIEFGTDDGHKLWLNGKKVAEANRGGAAVPGDFKASVELRQGWNALLLKVVQDTGPWEFCLRVRSASGEKIEGLRVQAAPPAE